MVSLEFRVSSPLKVFKILYYRTVKLTTNWCYEFNLYRNNLLIGISFDLRTRGDHKGLDMSIGILHHELEFNVYDIRHESIEEYA